MKQFFWNDVVSENPDFMGMIKSSKGSGLSIGGFDGPHLGHRCLLDKVLEKKDLLHGVVTFLRSPSSVTKSNFLGDVSSTRLRLKYFDEIGFDFVILIDFSLNFGKMQGRVFFDILTEKCNLKFLSVGPDFRCGYQLDTGIKEIAEIADVKKFQFVVSDVFLLNFQKVSSTRIRNSIIAGDLGLVERMLGHPFQLDCTSLEWTESKTAWLEEMPNCKSFDAIVNFTQCLPPVGLYNVFVDVLKCYSTEKSSVISFESVLYIGNQNLRLCLPNNIECSVIQTITFRLS